MEYSELEQNIKKALQILIEKDKYLFINDLSERSIVNRFAVYINEIFQDSGYNVDCEYNGLPNESRKRKYLKLLIDDLINLNLILSSTQPSSRRSMTI